MRGKIDIFTFIFLSFLLLNGFCSINGDNVKTKKSVDENDPEDTDEMKDESLGIVPENEVGKNRSCTRRQNAITHAIRAAVPNQFPFMAAVMSQQNEYLCSGSIVSNGMVLTTAQCIQNRVSYVLINVTKDRKDSTSVVLHVTKSDKFPTYAGPESSERDVGVLYTENHNATVASKISLSNHTNAKGLLEFEAIGFGLNAEVGKLKELQYVGLEIRGLSGDIMSGYLDCVDTTVPSCFKDTGGPAVFDDKLVGIVIKGGEECVREMSSAFSANKYMTSVLPTYLFKSWLDDLIAKNEKTQNVALVSYPIKPTLTNFRRSMRPVSANGSVKTKLGSISLVIYIIALLNS